MIKRDSESTHSYSEKIFDEIGINEIQGLLKEENEFKCGVEAYQVRRFDLIDFNVLNQNEELAKYIFCKKLNIPYYLIVIAEDIEVYKIFKSVIKFDQVEYELLYTFRKETFLKWWRYHQSFDQKKDMYNAKKRLSRSIIDRDLFDNSLAWGSNIDGFILDEKTEDIKAIIEKRICTYKPPSYKISNYDPDKFFHGTRNRSGDYPSWKILFDLSQVVNAPLFLLTFDTSPHNMVGVSKILDVDPKEGLTYQDGLKPYQNIFNDNVNELRNWISKNL